MKTLKRKVGDRSDQPERDGEPLGLGERRFDRGGAKRGVGTRLEGPEGKGRSNVTARKKKGGKYSSEPTKGAFFSFSRFYFNQTLALSVY